MRKIGLLAVLLLLGALSALAASYQLFYNPDTGEIRTAPSSGTNIVGVAFTTNPLATEIFVGTEIGKAARVFLYGSTNVHPVSGVPGTLVDDPVSVLWSMDVAANIGTNLVGRFVSTNAYTLFKGDTWFGRTWVSKDAATEVYGLMCYETISTNFATTNLLKCSALEPLSSQPIDSYDLAVTPPNDVEYPATNPHYACIAWYIVRVGNPPVNVTTYGGNDYNTHLRGPGFSSSGVYLTRTQADALYVTNGTPLGGGSSPYGYISGCWPQYVDTNTVVITNGDGYCYDTYFAVTNPAGISVDVSTWATTNWNGAAGWGCQYIYCDYDGSTFPNGPVLYAATNLPVYDTVRNGWYNSATPQDRKICGLLQSNTATMLYKFVQVADTLAIEPYIQFASTMTPTANWLVPDDHETDKLTPVGATHVHVRITGQDIGDSWYSGGLAAEAATLLTHVPHQGELVNGSLSGGAGGAYGWITLGPSRKIRIGGVNGDDAALNGYFYRWRDGR